MTNTFFSYGIDGVIVYFVCFLLTCQLLVNFLSHRNAGVWGFFSVSLRAC